VLKTAALMVCEARPYETRRHVVSLQTRLDQ
jgi:hypothetical protein